MSSQQAKMRHSASFNSAIASAPWHQGGLLTEIKKYVESSSFLQWHDWKNASDYMKTKNKAFIAATTCFVSSCAITKHLTKHTISPCSFFGPDVSIDFEFRGAFSDFVAKSKNGYTHSSAQSLFDTTHPKPLLFFVTIGQDFDWSKCSRFYGHSFLIEKINIHDSRKWRIYQSRTKYFTIAQMLCINQWPQKQWYSQPEQEQFNRHFRMLGNGRKINEKELLDFLNEISQENNFLLSKAKIYIRSFDVSYQAM
jgi:hypothetical protein